MNAEREIYADLQTVKEKVYDKCGFVLTEFKFNNESVKYGACAFKINEQKIEHRLSKITPKKEGQFVTIWKRNKNGITEPLNILDDFDFVVITSKRNGDLGQFIFPKSVLAINGIISQNAKEGKRGIRVYPTWDVVTNKQAEKTQAWQAKFFVTMADANSISLESTKKLFSSTYQLLKHRN